MARYRDDRWNVGTVKWSGPWGTRTRGHPVARWADEIASVGRKWLAAATDREKWKALEEAFTRRRSIVMHVIFLISV